MLGNPIAAALTPERETGKLNVIPDLEDPLGFAVLLWGYGQVLWSLSHGQEPDQILKDQLRDLRQLGIPEASNTSSPGSGNRVLYDFHDLVELGIAAKGLELRFRPKDVVTAILDDRENFRKVITAAWQELPDPALAAPWVKSRGKTIAITQDEYYIRLHDRRSEHWGKLEYILPERLGHDLSPTTLEERFPDGETRSIIQLKQSMLPWVAWALEAPEPRRGPM